MKKLKFYSAVALLAFLSLNKPIKVIIQPKGTGVKIAIRERMKRGGLKR